MTDPIDPTLSRVAEDVFAGLAFMFPLEDQPATESSSVDSAVAATVRFDGPMSGRLEVAITDDLLHALATNMLGLADGEAPTQEQEHDALKELSNVLCGNLLPAIAGSEAFFAVQPPEMAVAGPKPDSEPTARARISLSEGHVVLTFFVEKESREAGVVAIQDSQIP